MHVCASCCLHSAPVSGWAWPSGPDARWRQWRASDSNCSLNLVTLEGYCEGLRLVGGWVKLLTSHEDPFLYRVVGDPAHACATDRTDGLAPFCPLFPLVFYLRPLYRACGNRKISLSKS